MARNEDYTQKGAKEPTSPASEWNVKRDYSSLISPTPFHQSSTSSQSRLLEVQKRCYINGKLTDVKENESTNQYENALTPTLNERREADALAVNEANGAASFPDSDSPPSSENNVALSAHRAKFIDSKSKSLPNIEIVSLKAVERQDRRHSDTDSAKGGNFCAVSSLIRQHEELTGSTNGSIIDGRGPETTVTAELDHFQPYDADGLDTITEEISESQEGEGRLQDDGIPTYVSPTKKESTHDCEDEIFEDCLDEPLVQTLMRQDSSENVVIEIKPKERIESPTTLLLHEQKRSKSVENLAPQDYLVVRANRKLAIQNQARLSNEENESCVKVASDSFIPLDSNTASVRTSDINTDYPETVLSFPTSCASAFNQLQNNENLENKPTASADIYANDTKEGLSLLDKLQGRGAGRLALVQIKMTRKWRKYCAVLYGRKIQTLANLVS